MFLIFSYLNMWSSYWGPVYPDVIEYSKKAFESLSQLTNLEDLDILDVGCGTGLLAESLSPLANRIVALDSSKKMIRVLQSKGLDNVETITAELTESSIHSNEILQSKFDLIVASSVCAFLPDYEGTLELIFFLLKANGLFVQWDWKRTDDDSQFGFTEEMIGSAFRHAGFDVSSFTEPFYFESEKGNMTVIMGVAKKGVTS